MQDTQVGNMTFAEAAIARWTDADGVDTFDERDEVPELASSCCNATPLFAGHNVADGSIIYRCGDCKEFTEVGRCE